MSPIWVLLLFYFWTVNPHHHRDASCVDIHASLLYEVFHLIVVSLSSFSIFISLCVAFVVVFALLALRPGLYSAAYRTNFLA